MHFSLGHEQSLFQTTVARFARERLGADALTRARDPAFPWDVAKEAAAQGLLGISIPEEDGGQGGSLMDAVLAIEQAALVCPRSADVIQAGNFGAIRALALYGSPEQKQKHLGRLLQGEGLIAVAMSEPEAGAAVTDLATMATPEGEGYRLNGSKIFTTHSLDADLFLVYVRFGKGVGGIGSVLVSKDAPGLVFGPASAFMSGEQWRSLTFDNAYIPAADVLLPAGGFKKQIASFNVERIGNSARALALGRHAFNLARDHALNRRQFGRPICEFQGVQWKFAEMATKLDAAQLLLYRAAVNADSGIPSAQETSMAKLACNRAGFEVANEALQVMGGTGFCEDNLVSYCLQRTRGWMIAGGPVEMMLNRIAEGVFERRFSQRPPLPSDQR